MHPGSRSPIAWAVGAGADYAARRAEVEAYERALRLLPEDDPMREKFLEDGAEALVYLERNGAEYRDAFASLAPRDRGKVLGAFGSPPKGEGAPGVALHRPAVAEAATEVESGRVVMQAEGSLQDILGAIDGFLPADGPAPIDDPTPTADPDGPGLTAELMAAAQILLDPDGTNPPPEGPDAAELAREARRDYQRGLGL
jgi:hypothetical protein